MSITTLNYIDTLYQLVSIDLCRESITTSICYALQKIITTYVKDECLVAKIIYVDCSTI